MQSVCFTWLWFLFLYNASNAHCVTAEYKIKSLQKSPTRARCASIKTHVLFSIVQWWIFVRWNSSKRRQPDNDFFRFFCTELHRQFYKFCITLTALNTEKCRRERKFVCSSCVRQQKTFSRGKGMRHENILKSWWRSTYNLCIFRTRLKLLCCITFHTLLYLFLSRFNYAFMDG